MKACARHDQLANKNGSIAVGASQENQTPEAAEPRRVTPRSASAVASDRRTACRGSREFALHARVDGAAVWQSVARDAVRVD
jgi:hypothetical protein